jgi:hypothetical protein
VLLALVVVEVEQLELVQVLKEQLALVHLSQQLSIKY